MTAGAAYSRRQTGCNKGIAVGRFPRPAHQAWVLCVNDAPRNPGAGIDSSSATDQELLREAQAGSRQAFETLVLRYRLWVTRLAARFLPNPADAEDLAQDAFVRAFANLSRCRPGVPFRNWLMRLTVNLCLDRLRYRRRRPERSASQMHEEDGGWMDNRLDRDAEALYRRLESEREARDLLRRVVPRLSPADQVLLHLLYGEELEVPEVAQLMGWSAVNVRVRAFRARRQLKRILEEMLES